MLIRAGSDGFAATMQGEALEWGGKGDGIKVRNSSSGRVIQAGWSEKGVVETRFRRLHPVAGGEGKISGQEITRPI